MTSINTGQGTGTYGPIGSWDVSNVDDFGYLFMDARNFNADISRWRLLEVLGIGTTPSSTVKGDRRNGLKSMFKGAWNFEQDLCGPGWNAVRDEINVGKRDMFQFTGRNEFNSAGLWSGFECCAGGTFYDKGTEWTLTVTEQELSQPSPNAGGNWKMGSILKHNLWTLDILPQDITAVAGVAVTQGSVTGKLHTSLTGAGMTKVVITTVCVDCSDDNPIDPTFDVTTDVVIGTGGAATTILLSNIDIAKQATGVLHKTMSNEKLTSFSFVTRYDATIVPSADIIIGTATMSSRVALATITSAKGVSLRGTQARGVCTACPAGQYQDDSEVQQETCKSCERNYFTSPAGGALKCTPCLTGAFSEPGATSCTMCPVGQHIVTDSSTNFPTGCAKCIEGTFQSKQGQKTCDACPKGYQQNEKEGIFCLPCGPGKTQHENGKKDCVDCSVGLFMANSGSTTNDCDDCIKGQFNNQVGQFKCKSCPAGTWSATLKLDDASKCTKCIAGTYSKAKGADKLDTCIDCKLLCQLLCH